MSLAEETKMVNRVIPNVPYNTSLEVDLHEILVAEGIDADHAEDMISAGQVRTRNDMANPSYEFYVMDVLVTKWTYNMTAPRLFEIVYSMVE